MSDRYIERWVVSEVRGDGFPTVKNYCDNIAIVRKLTVGGDLRIAQCFFAKDEVGLDAAIADAEGGSPTIHAIIAKSLSQTKLSTKAKNFLAAHNVTLDPGDNGTNVIRKIRDLLINKPIVRERSFNISD